MSAEFEDHCWKGIIPANMRDIYKAYERETYVGPNPALLLVDYYKSVFAGGPIPIEQADKLHCSSLGERAWVAVPPTVKLLVAARAAGLPVIYTTNAVTDVRVTSRRKGPSSAADFEILDEVKPAPGDLVIAKARASGFFGTPLVAHLRQMKVDSLIIGGTTTSGCLRATVLDAQSYGFHISLVEECTFDRFDLTHQINLFDLHHKYADVMHLDEVVAHLEKMAAKRSAA